MERSFGCFRVLLLMLQKSEETHLFEGKVVYSILIPSFKTGFFMTIQNAGFLSENSEPSVGRFQNAFSTEERDNIPSFQHAMWLSIITMTSAT